MDAFWRGRLIAALKTGLACIMAGLLLQEGKKHVDWMAFPLFSFIITVTVVGESTLGRGLHDAMRVLAGTMQSTAMTVMVMKFLYPRTSSLAASLSCIGISSFLIMYPKATHTLSKRVALAQTAIVYMTAYLQQDKMNGLLFPLRLAATTLTGTAIATISILLPIPPRFAYFEIKQQTRNAAHTVAEAFKTMISAFCCEDAVTFSSLILQAQSLLKSGSSIIASLKEQQADMAWEFKCFHTTSSVKLFAQGVAKLKLPLVGMDMAFQSGYITQSSDMVKNVLQESLHQLSEWSNLALRLGGANHNTKFSNTHSQKQIVVEEGRELLESFDEGLGMARQKVSFFGQDENLDDLFEELLWKKSHLYSKAGSGNRKIYTNIGGSFQSQITAMFFLYNMKIFLLETMAIVDHDHNKLKVDQITMSPPVSRDMQNRSENFPCVICHGSFPQSQLMRLCNHEYATKTRAPPHTNPSRATNCVEWSIKMVRFKPDIDQLTIALKIAIAMTIAAYLGVMYDPDHSHWADITIAMGIGNYQKGSLRISNMRLQGTVCGSIYGYLLALITRQVPGLCLAAMIPWVVLTSFLRKSKMYGYSGSVSAVVAAMILLGKKRSGPLEIFAMIRMTETFLGLTCFALVEIFLWPRRAAVLLEKELTQGLLDLKSCMALVFKAKRDILCAKCRKAIVEELKEKVEQLRGSISRQNAFIDEAKLEPEFWHGAFQGGIYSKMTEIQSKMVDLLQVLISSSMDLKIAGSTSEERAIKSFIMSVNAPIRVIEDDCLATFKFLHEVLQLKQQNKRIKQNHSPKICKTKDQKEDPTQNQVCGGALNRICSFLRTGLDSIKSKTKISSNNSFEGFNPTSFRKHHNLHSLMAVFESNYEDAVDRLALSNAKPIMSSVSSAVVLSFSALTFCVHGLLKETLELEKCVIELLQVEHPWVLLSL